MKIKNISPKISNDPTHETREKLKLKKEKDFKPFCTNC